MKETASDVGSSYRETLGALRCLPDHRETIARELVGECNFTATYLPLHFCAGGNLSNSPRFVCALPLPLASAQKLP